MTVSAMRPHGERIRNERIRRALSQADLADRAGVRQATVSSVERGRPARFGTIRALADALSVLPEEIILYD